MLVIRGELLKRYPNAVIYAQKAEWAAHRWRRSIHRRSARWSGSTPAEEANPPRDEAAHAALHGEDRARPLFPGLRSHRRRGARRRRHGRQRSAGLVLRHQGAAGRAALRVRRDGHRDRSSSGTTSPGIACRWRAGTSRALPPPGIQIPASVPPGEEEKEDQRKEDVQVRWDDDVSAAELAYILFQAPAMVAVHAAEMLPRKAPA